MMNEQINEAKTGVFLSRGRKSFEITLYNVIMSFMEHTYTTSMEQEIVEAANSMINLSGNTEAYDQLFDPYQPASTTISKNLKEM